MAVPILKQGAYLIASIQSALTDSDLVQLRDALVGQVGSYRSRGVIVDVTALDVLDSFASRTLRDLAHMIRLRGAETVIVGIQPQDGGVPGIVIIARDEGPGIPDVNRAMEQGYSTSGGLGLGLPGVRRIMDKFEIVSEVGKGTVVTVVKWKR